MREAQPHICLEGNAGSCNPDSSGEARMTKKYGNGTCVAGRKSDVEAHGWVKTEENKPLL